MSTHEPPNRVAGLLIVTSRDLPFDQPSDLPDVFTSYRKSVEPLRDAPRKTVPMPPSLPPVPTMVPSQPGPFSIPDTYERLESMLMEPLRRDPVLTEPLPFPAGAASAHPFHGGSVAGTKRVQALISSGAMTRYKETRNGLLERIFPPNSLPGWRLAASLPARYKPSFWTSKRAGTKNTKTPTGMAKVRTPAQLPSASSCCGGTT